MPLSSISPEADFKFVLSEACVLSSLPRVCGCLVVAHLSVMPKICVISAIIVEVNADPLSVMRTVGRYECFVMISLSLSLRLWQLPQLAGRQIGILKRRQSLSSPFGILH